MPVIAQFKKGLQFSPKLIYTLKATSLLVLLLYCYYLETQIYSECILTNNGSLSYISTERIFFFLIKKGNLSCAITNLYGTTGI